MPLELSQSERLILANQYAILEKLDPENENVYQNRREIIEQGYAGLYDRLGDLETEVDREVWKEVGDILEMFRLLQYNYKKLDDQTGIGQWELEFEGFDANEQDGHFYLTRFMIEDLGQWADFAESKLNSHSGGTLPMYRRMLRRYRTVPDRKKMTREEILDIIEAREFPG